MSERLDRQFAKFDAANPEMWRLYVYYARELKSAGRNRGSSEQIIQRIRWDAFIKPNTKNGYKISNNFRRRYAEKLVRTHPKEFTGFFQFRKQKCR